MAASEGKKLPVQVWVWLGLATVGLYDAILLTVEHYTRRGLPCTLSGGCERVLTSRFSEFGGVPTAALGIVFYLVVLFAIMYYVTNQQRPNKYLMLGWSTIGFVTSLGLTSIQAFVIKAWCQYCLLSALTSTLIFLTAVWYWRANAKVRAHNTADEELEGADNKDEEEA